MACKHLKELYEFCHTHDLRLSSTDLVRIICPRCGEEEVCPSMLFEQYEARHPDQDDSPKAAKP
jgi:predicted RNA-binding Zn-ribbon protein involved in translation (DUF1610 family)